MMVNSPVALKRESKASELLYYYIVGAFFTTFGQGLVYRSKCELGTSTSPIGPSQILKDVQSLFTDEVSRRIIESVLVGPALWL